MKTLVVTAALIIDKDKILIAQRKAGSHQGLKWEFPGGKVEPGEDPADCLVREIREELDIDIEVDDIYQVVSHNYEERHIILLCYKCRQAGGALQNLDCQDSRWVAVTELPAYDFAPADVPVVRKLMGTP